MPVKITDHRWKVAPNEFATRIIIPDLKGWFGSLPILGSLPKSRSLVIEPGTRSVIIEDVPVESLLQSLPSISLINLGFVTW